MTLSRTDRGGSGARASAVAMDVAMDPAPAAPSDDDASLRWNDEDSSDAPADAPADALDAVVDELKSRGYRTCLVVGPGSSGKTTLLRRLGPVIDPGALRWDSGKAVVSQVAPGDAPAAAIERLLGSGLSTIPTWTQPFSSLSNGEKARAVVARCLESGVGLDDLGSEVHWRAATTAAACVRQLVERRKLRRVAFASALPDVARWLQPCALVVLDVGAAPRVVWNPRRGDERRTNVRVRCRQYTHEQMVAGPVAFRSLRGAPKQLTARDVAGADGGWWAGGFRSCRVRAARTLACEVEADACTAAAAEALEVDFDGTCSKRLRLLRREDLMRAEFGLGVVCGPSGSGKSTLLDATFGGVTSADVVDGPTVLDALLRVDPPDLARRRLAACGLEGFENRRVGELSRSAAALLKVAAHVGDNAVLDEVCTGLDAGAAVAVAASLGAFVRERGFSGVVVATCVDAVAEALRPDWAFRTTTGELRDRTDAVDDDAAAIAGVGDRSRAAWAAAVAAALDSTFAPPTVDVRLEPCANEVWDRFKQHHYLARKLSGAARCFVALDAEGAAVAFDSRVSKRGAFAFSQSRFVVLPDFQGLGLANALADAVARIHFRVGLLYYSRTSHPRLGASRNRSSKWRACDSNGQAVEATCCLRKRRGYSHLFVGCAAAGDVTAFRAMANAKDLALVLRKTASENYTERGARCARCDAARPRGANHARCAGACGLSYCGDCLAARGEVGAPARWKCSDCAARDAEKDTKKQRPAKKKAKPDAGARSVLSMLSFRPRGASPPPRKPPAAPPKPPPSDDAVIVIDHSDDEQSSEAAAPVRRLGTPRGSESPRAAAVSLDKKPRDEVFSDDDDAASSSSSSSSSSDDDDSDDEDFNDEPWMKGGTKRPRRLSAKLD